MFDAALLVRTATCRSYRELQVSISFLFYYVFIFILFFCFHCHVVYERGPQGVRVVRGSEQTAESQIRPGMNSPHNPVPQT